MKKYILKTLLLLIVVAPIFNSCSDDIVKADYDYEQNTSSSLAKVTLNSVEATSETAIACNATITALGESPIYDYGFMYSSDQSFKSYETISLLSDEGPATGEELEFSAEFEQGITFYFKAFVSTQDGLSVSSDVKSVILPITWTDIGKVLFTDETYGLGSATVVIQKFEGQNYFRLKDVYNALSNSVSTGKHLHFYLNDDYNANGLNNGAQDLGTSYQLYWYLPDYAAYCSFTNTANVYNMTFLLLQGGTLYTGGAASFEWTEGYPGEIPEPISIAYKTDFSDAESRAGWTLDKYSGVGEDDNVFYFDMAKAGVASWGHAIVAYNDGTSQKIISPAIDISNEEDILSFGLYSGLFGSEVNAKVKVYIREVGGELDLDTPVKDWDLAEGGGSTAIPLTDYVGKSIKVIFVVEEGDFLFYHFAVATSSNANQIFR